VGASYNNGPRCPSVCHTRISPKLSEIHLWLVGNSNRKRRNGFANSESAIRFTIGRTVPPFWVFPGRHFTHCDRNGELELVNGPVRTITSPCHLAEIVHDHTYRSRVRIGTGKRISASGSVVSNSHLGAYLRYQSRHLHQMLYVR